MANPNTRETLKQYALRALGKPVIEINVEDDQLEDRIDEALQFFAQYHYDGIERMYLKYQITAADIARARANSSTVVTDTADSTVSATWQEGTNYIPVPDSVVSILEVFPFTDKSNLNLFDVRYQLRLNDLYDFSSTSVIHYDMTMRHLDFLDSILVGEKPIRFNQHQNRLYIDMDWSNDVSAGEFILIKCYRKLDPTIYTDIYNDILLKKYVTQLFKRQWGANLIKFNQVQMLGGTTLNGEVIYQQAQEEINKIEEQIQLQYETPVNYMIG
jgi:hypothetical protein